MNLRTDVFKASSALMSNRVFPNKPFGPDFAEPDLTLRNMFSFASRVFTINKVGYILSFYCHSSHMK